MPILLVHGMFTTGASMAPVALLLTRESRAWLWCIARIRLAFSFHTMRHALPPQIFQRAHASYRRWRGRSSGCWTRWPRRRRPGRWTSASDCLAATWRCLDSPERRMFGTFTY